MNGARIGPFAAAGTYLIFKAVFGFLRMIFKRPKAFAWLALKIGLILGGGFLALMLLAASISLSDSCKSPGIVWKAGMAQSSKDPAKICAGWGMNNGLCRTPLEVVRIFLVAGAQATAYPVCYGSRAMEKLVQ